MERRYSLSELGITEAAAEALTKGRAQVVPTLQWAGAMTDAASVIADAEDLEWPDVAFLAYGQLLAASPFGYNANDAIARMQRESREAA